MEANHQLWSMLLRVLSPSCEDYEVEVEMVHAAITLNSPLGRGGDLYSVLERY